MRRIESVVLTDAETISRSNWARDLVYSKILLNFILRQVAPARIERAIYEILGDFPATIDYKEIFPVNHANRRKINPFNKVKATLKIAFWIGAFLEIHREISRMPKILEKMGRKENKNHFLLQRLRAIRYKSESEYFSYELGSMQSKEVKVFRNALLSGVGVIVTPSKSVYLADPASNPKQSFVAGLWNHLSFNPSINKISFHGLLQSGTVSKEYKKGIDLTGRCSSNYWHALIEYAPRILNFDLKIMPPVFISKDMPRTVREALLQINPKIELVEISDEHWIRVGELYVPRFHSKTLDSGPVPASLMFEFDEKILQDFSKRALSSLKSGNSFVPKKIYLKRSSQFRSPVGVENLEKYLEENGFVFISPEQCSFVEQVQLFQGADIVITFGGAAWANLIFGNPNSTYISITTEASAPFDMHAQIAKLFKLDYHQLISRSNVNNEELSPFYRFYCHHSVKVTSEMLEKLKELLS